MEIPGDQRVSNVRKEKISTTWTISNAEDFLDEYVRSISIPNFLRCSIGNWIMDVELKLEVIQNPNRSYNSYSKQEPRYVNFVPTFRVLQQGRPLILPHFLEVVLKAPDNGKDYRVEIQPSSGSQQGNRLLDLTSGSSVGKKWIANNAIRIEITVTQCWVEHFYDGTGFSAAAEEPPHAEKHLNVVRFWETKDFADCKIEILEEKKTIDAHRIVLAATSPVFAALLKSGSKNVIQISGFTSKVVEEFLHFLYIGQIRDVDDMAAKLMGIAGQYEVRQLFTRCEEILCSQLNVTDVVDTLRLANRQQATRVKEAAKNFIVTNFDQVLETAAWKDLLSANSELANEVLKLLSNTTHQ